MRFAPPTRLRVTVGMIAAGIVLLSLSLAGSAWASTATTTHRKHARHSSAQQKATGSMANKGRPPSRIHTLLKRMSSRKTTSRHGNQRHVASHPTSIHPTAHHSASQHAAARHGSQRHARSRHRHHAMVGQRSMDAQRATEIQQALIQAHYLNGPPTGLWDAASQAAMVKYQDDNGWQTKITPDSRALIKLGLGPKQDEGEYAAVPATSSKSSPASIGGGAGASSRLAPADSAHAAASSEMPPGTQN